MRRNVFLQIHSRRNFNQHYAILCQLKHSPLGNIQNLLSGLARISTTECNLFYLFQQLYPGALFEDCQASIGNAGIKAPIVNVLQ